MHFERPINQLCQCTRRLPAMTVLTSCLALSACMTVHIDAGREPVRVVRHLGLLHIEVQAPDRALIAQLSGTGLAVTPVGLTLGYAKQRFVAAGPQCRAVLWFEDGAALDTATRLKLGKLAGVCLAEDRTTHLKPE